MTTDEETDTTPDRDAEDDMLDRLDAGLPPASPEEQAARAPYERLAAMIRDRPITPAPTGMRERLRGRWLAERAAIETTRRRQRRRAIAVGFGAAGAIAAAAIALIVLTRSSAPFGEAFTMRHRAADGITRAGTGDDVVVGGVVELRAQPVAAHTELRVYLGTRLVVRCPDDARCKGLSIDLPITDPGTYQVLRMSSSNPLPVQPGDLEGDRLAILRAGADVKLMASFRARL